MNSRFKPEFISGELTGKRGSSINMLTAEDAVLPQSLQRGRSALRANQRSRRFHLPSLTEDPRSYFEMTPREEKPMKNLIGSMLRDFCSLVLCILLIAPQQARAQDPLTLAGLGGLTLNEALNSIADRVDSSIEKAGTVANGVVIRAGSEVSAEIDNLRAAANDVLGTSVKDLDSAIRDQLGEVVSDANLLESRTASDAQKLLQLAQGVTNTIPFSKTQPQVTSLSPNYAVFDPGDPQAFVQLVVRGNFFDSALPGMAPSIIVNNKPLELIEVTTTHFIFNVPTSLFSLNASKPRPLVKLPITVPFNEKFLVFFNSRREAHFTAALLALPPSPGTITVKTTSSTDSTQRDFVSTHQDNIQSDRDDHDEIRCGPNETHTIDPASINLIFDHIEGSTWTAHPVRLNNPSVCWHFRTEHHGIGTSDKLFFHFTYFVSFSLPRSSTATQTFSLKWGDSRVVDAPVGQFTITFNGFDGSTQQFRASNHDNRFIDISPEGGGVRIAARPLDGILPLD